MKKMLVLLSLLLFNVVLAMSKPYCADSRGLKYDFGRYTFDGCRDIQISFPFVKECSEEIGKYLEENNFTYQLSDTFEQLKKYCSEPYTKLNLNVDNEFENLNIKFGRVYHRCKDFERYCNQRENELFARGYLGMSKEELIKILRKLKRNKPTALCKIKATADKSSVEIGPTVMEETLQTDVEITFVCNKSDNTNIACSFVDVNGNEAQNIAVQANVKDFNALNKQIQKEHNKKSSEYDELHRKAKKECPGLYRTLQMPQGYNANPTIKYKAAKRWQELLCDMWLNGDLN